MNIPTTKSNIQLDLLHPRFVTRLEAFFQDPQIKGKVAVSSGCRSYADQKYYYDRYKSGRSTILAANPDRRFGEKGLDGLGIWRGSWHMSQLDGWCYAVDLAQMDKSISKPEINRIATMYGVQPTVASEWWHHQPRKAVDWFEAPALKGESTEAPDAPEPKIDWAAIAAAIKKQRQQVRKTPLTKGSKGAAVKTIQTCMGNQGIRCGVADGIFGRKTATAVKQLQKNHRLPVNGIVDIKTFDVSFKERGR